jgi:ribosomal protein S18 acetylase RimI-like enzyme
MVVRRLDRNDAMILRDIRLRALRSDPSAFGSSYEEESSYDDRTWSDFLGSDRPGDVFIAETDGATVGMAGIRTGEKPESAVLWGMWVSPEARGTGIGRALVEASVTWAGAKGARDVVLQVAEGNDSARRLYERCGFEVIGRSPLRSDDPCSLATLMRLDLGAG